MFEPDPPPPWGANSAVNMRLCFEDADYALERRRTAMDDYFAGYFMRVFWQHMANAIGFASK